MHKHTQHTSELGRRVCKRCKRGPRWFSYLRPVDLTYSTIYAN